VACRVKPCLPSWPASAMLSKSRGGAKTSRYRYDSSCWSELMRNGLSERLHGCCVLGVGLHLRSASNQKARR